MEPSIWTGVLSWSLIHVTPFAAFALGVYISIRLNLTGDLSTEHVVLMSIPVGILTIGNLLMIITVQVNDPDSGETLIRYGHMNSVGQFLVFIGTVILYGTLVPQLFDQVRRQIQKKVTGGGE